jgi:hypothetical protein
MVIFHATDGLSGRPFSHAFVLIAHLKRAEPVSALPTTAKASEAVLNH